MQSPSDPLYDVMLNPDDYEDPTALVRRRIASVETAIERVLGAPQGSLPFIDDRTMAAWFED